MPARPFDVDALLALPRVARLVLSPAGDRLVAEVAVVTGDAKHFATALWELDAGGHRPPRRLTRSRAGEANPAFAPDGSLLFTSSRPDPDPDDGDGGERGEGRGGDEVSAIWALPAGAGEARVVARPPGGVEALAVARSSGTVAYAALSFPGTTSAQHDEARAAARTDAGVSAQLFERYPIRHWDHYLGPRSRRLFVASAPAAPDLDAGLVDVRDITPDAGGDLDETSFDVTPDGRTVVTGWRRVDDVSRPCTDLVAVDTATGRRRTLLAADGHHRDVRCSPDGRWAACVRATNGRPNAAMTVTLWLVDLAGGDQRELTPGFDRWPGAPVWSPDATTVWFVADDGGHALAFAVDVASGDVRRLGGHHTLSSLCAAPGGSRLYALASTTESPPRAVVLDASPATGGPAQGPPPAIPTPGWPLEVPGRAEELVATADDGVRVRATLVLPPGASPEQPAPLAVLVHGGPLASWSGWQWRWNPHVFAQRGYAVLLPDPALSTGYGQAFIDRGWGAWGARPYTDLMASVDAASSHPHVDGARAALLGGSFGGYMANWVAGHCDRFRAIVTHAGLWALDQFHGTTDLGVWWEHEFGDPYVDTTRYVENSPNRHVAAIRSPMLVIHGEHDHRVPIGEGLRLWTDLKRHDLDAKFLYFPDEHHWITKPPNIRVWYATVLAFLDHHVLGAPWEPPDVL